MLQLPVLIVEDQRRVAKALALLLELHDLPSLTVDRPEAALKLIEEHQVGVILQDMNFTPGAATGDEGIKLFHQLRSRRPEVPILLLTAWGSVEHAVRLIQDGAADYIEKPWDDAKLIERIEELLAETQGDSTEDIDAHRRLLKRQSDLGGLVYVSPEMHEVVVLGLKIARSNVPVLITGPNGSGKECIAELVQRNSTRAKESFVRVNVGALPDSLLESELFGSEPGAFTGAAKRRIGRFEAADGGTLLLDEIGNLSADGQAKLLRILQTGQYERLGSSSSRTADVRILAATNKDLVGAIERGEFREDLYFRLKVIELAVPSLKDRPSDVLPLAEHFMQQLTPRDQGPFRLSDAARQALRRHPWPGNVRELRNAIQRAVLIASGHALQPADLGLADHKAVPSGSSERGSDRNESASEPVSEERRRIEQVLLDSGGVVARAADQLGMSRQALYRRMRRLGVVLERRPRSEETDSEDR